MTETCFQNACDCNSSASVKYKTGGLVFQSVSAVVLILWVGTSRGSPDELVDRLFSQYLMLNLI